MGPAATETAPRSATAERRRHRHAAREAEELPGVPRDFPRRPGAADDVREHEEDDEEAREREDREHDERVGEPERKEGAAVMRVEEGVCGGGGGGGGGEQRR